MASVALTDAPGWREAPRDTSPIAWVLHDGKAGMENEAFGCVEATAFRSIEKRLAIRHPWIRLPPRLWFLPFRAAGNTGASLRLPWTDLVVPVAVIQRRRRW